MSIPDYTSRFIEPDDSPTAWYEPVTLEEVKAQSRITITDEDEILIQGIYIPAARKKLEGRIGEKLGVQTWELAFRWWPAWGVIEIPRPFCPLQSVVRLAYTDFDGVETVLYDSEASPPVDTGVFGFSLNSKPGFLYLKPNQVLPTAHLYPGYPIVVRVTVGTPLANVAQNLKAEIVVITASLFEHREGEVPIPDTGLIDANRDYSY